MKSRFVFAVCVCCLLLAERKIAAAEPADNGRIPAFALGRLTIARIGPFLDRTAAFANQISSNSGPIAKMAFANVLFKVPFDQSIKFDGPAVIYLLEPLNPGPNQETASILPVADAAALKKNLAGVYGEPEEKNGAALFTIPQPLPQPDKILYLKIAGNQALLAPTEEALKELERALQNAPSVLTEGAELELSVTAFKRLYGKQVEASMQMGAAMAAENVESLKDLNEQVAGLQKTLWDIDTLNLRVEFDKDSKQVAVELALVPRAGTGLAALFAKQAPSLKGKFITLLPSNAPILISAAIDGQACFDFLTNNFKLGREAQMTRTLSDFLDGETCIGINVAPFSFLAATSDPKNDKFATTKELYQHALDLAVRQGGEAKSLFSVASEMKMIPGTYLSIHLNKPKPREAGLDNLAGTLLLQAQAAVSGGLIFSIGNDPKTPVKSGLDRALKPTPLPAEIAAIFNAPAPGTFVLVALRAVELTGHFVSSNLPGQITYEQLTAGLEDVPISGAFFSRDGKVGVRATLPGLTAGSFMRMYFRLKRANVDVLGILGELLAANATGAPVPKAGNVAAPPPPEK